ncbi:hypothetical protein JW964_08855 [candidate division KSB1 bacterium]|nr:hypothetical protein [candidate division KSB1 bacterium]
METSIEKVIKFSLFFVLLILSLLIWLLPKTAFAKRFKMNEKIFILTNWLGIICGTLGMVATLIWQEFVIETHLMWLIIFPWVIMEFYSLLVIRSQKTSNIMDEKQEYNLTKAGSLAAGLSISIMTGVFLLYEAQILTGSLWFPVYLFLTVLLISFFTLLLFKRE